MFGFGVQYDTSEHASFRLELSQYMVKTARISTAIWTSASKCYTAFNHNRHCYPPLSGVFCLDDHGIRRGNDRQVGVVGICVIKAHPRLNGIFPLLLSHGQCKMPTTHRSRQYTPCRAKDLQCLTRYPHLRNFPKVIPSIRNHHNSGTGKTHRYCHKYERGQSPRALGSVCHTY